MKQSLFSQIEHDKEDIQRLNQDLYTAESMQKYFEAIKSSADSHLLRYQYEAKDERHIFVAEAGEKHKKTCVLIASVENSQNDIVRWKQSMILSMCIGILFACNANAVDLGFNVKLFIISKDDEDLILTDERLKRADYCLLPDWGNDLKNSAASSAVLKNTFRFASACIPLNNQEYYGNPLICLSALDALSTDISSYLPKGAVIRIIPESYEKNDYFHLTELTVGAYTITGDEALAKEISGVLSGSAALIAKSCAVNLKDDQTSAVQLPFHSDAKFNKIFIHACKENGFIKANPAETNCGSVSAAKISNVIPSIHPCLGLIGTTKETDIEYRNKQKKISDAAASSLVNGTKAVICAMLDIFQINDK